MNVRMVWPALLLLSACSGGENADIKKWMEEESKGMRGKVEKIDEPKKFVPFKYEADRMVDPFSTAKVTVAAEEAKKAPATGGGPRPDLNRRKEVLEAYPLENLQMVGAMQQKGVNFAIIKADAGLHRVKVGNYMGQNFGIVTDIKETELTLKELVPDSLGDYAERTSTLQLQEKQQEGKK